LTDTSPSLAEADPKAKPVEKPGNVENAKGEAAAAKDVAVKVEAKAKKEEEAKEPKPDAKKPKDIDEGQKASGEEAVKE